MARRRDIDKILQDWNYEPGEVIARVINGADGRTVLQMRVEMGLLQMEVEGRPDGLTPSGFRTYLDLLRKASRGGRKDWEMNDEQCSQADREFLQYYHRRICWLVLRQYSRALLDADHTLELMDFVRAHCNDRDWVISHEQYRPFVLFHRTQAAALAALEESGPEAAIEEIGNGLKVFRELFQEYEAEEEYERDEFVQRLGEMKDALRSHYHVKPSLSEQLAEAVATEQYELAARLRDELHKKDAKPRR